MEILERHHLNRLRWVARQLRLAFKGETALTFSEITGTLERYTEEFRLYLEEGRELERSGGGGNVPAQEQGRSELELRGPRRFMSRQELELQDSE